MLTGMYPPSSGEATVGGHNIIHDMTGLLTFTLNLTGDFILITPIQLPMHWSQNVTKMRILLEMNYAVACISLYHSQSMADCPREGTVNHSHLPYNYQSNRTQSWFIFFVTRNKTGINARSTRKYGSLSSTQHTLQVSHCSAASWLLYPAQGTETFWNFSMKLSLFICQVTSSLNVF